MASSRSSRELRSEEGVVRRYGEPSQSRQPVAALHTQGKIGVGEGVRYTGMGQVDPVAGRGDGGVYPPPPPRALHTYALSKALGGVIPSLKQ